MLTTTGTKENKCPNCGKRVDAASSMEGQTPSPGDLTICFGCFGVMAFANDLTMRPLTADEMHEVATDPDIMGMLATRIARLKQALYPVRSRN
jgi:hypothetical protein